MLNKIWRLVATAISFMTFGVGGLILALLILPIVSLGSRDDNTRRLIAREIIHHSFRLFVNMMSMFRIFDFDISEAEKQLKEQKGKIIIANHPSLIDVVVLISILPHADCIVKQALWDNPFLRGVVRAAGYIKNSQNVEDLLLACKKSLNNGYSLIIFPEGTRTKPKTQLSLQRGASNIAIRCDVEMIPVTIRCKPSTLTKNEPWFSIPDRKANFSLMVGNTIKVSEFVKQDQSLSVSARRLTDHIKDYYTQELKSYA